jgi:hypothetical protein
MESITYPLWDKCVDLRNEALKRACWVEVKPCCGGSVGVVAV